MSETPIFDELSKAFGAPRDRSKYPEAVDRSQQPTVQAVAAFLATDIQLSPETAQRLSAALLESGRIVSAAQDRYWNDVAAALEVMNTLAMRLPEIGIAQ
jgi:hypothetical protein